MEHADMVSKYPNLTQAFVDEPDAFPHNLASLHERLALKIDVLWGSKACADFMQSLMLSDRPDRQGFSFDVLRELFALKGSHDAHFPQFIYNANDPYSTVVADVVRADAELRLELLRKDGGSTAAQRRQSKETKPAQPINPLVAPTKKPTEEAKAPATAPAATAPGAINPASTPAPTPIPIPTPNKSHWPELETLDELRRMMAGRIQGERLPTQDKRQLLEILRQYAGISDTDVNNAIKIQSVTGKKREPIGKVLLSMGVVSDEVVTRALCLQYGVVMVDLNRFQIPPDVMKMISLDAARKSRVVPIAVLDGVLFLAVENPFSFEEREYFHFLTKLKIELVMTSVGQITQRLAEYGQVRNVQQGNEEFSHLAKKALADKIVVDTNSDEQEDGNNLISQDDATVVGLVNKIISDAAEIGASDIHLESFPGDRLARIRFRRDGRMEEYSQYDASYHRAVVSRIKIMSSLNIAERRMAQDGKISFSRPGKERLDLRVATIPTVRSIENVTIRLLHAGEPLPLDKIKMGERDLAVFKRLIVKPYGLILVCGPTGSGKTTTLHSVLRELNKPDRKIWTAEDPIEIIQKNICQVQMNPKIGWTFATALRSFLRADPDIIMIGEMRDQETAKIALEASMTGHLVLSTLHTNSASETAARLLDLEIDPFNLADALVCVMAQRLTRSLCQNCAEKHAMTPAEIDELAAEYHFTAHQRIPSLSDKEAIIRDWQQRLTKSETLSLWQPKGCGQCNGEGYKGRVAIFELLEATPQFRELLAHKSSAADYQRMAVNQGMRTLKQDGIEKALLGLTDMTQVRGACN